MQNQDLTHARITETTFVGAARGFGVTATRVARGAELRDVLHEALASRAPRLIEIFVR